jgi:hypothetical protein
MTGVEFGSGVDKHIDRPFQIAVEQNGEKNAAGDDKDREQTPGAITKNAFENEFNHVIFPLNASVGFNLAIFRVGKKLTIVVARRIKMVVPITKPVP